jgi:hypothetical protein
MSASGGYNRVMKSVSIVALALTALAGCSNRNVDTLEAVKQGVIRDISKNVNIGAMDVNVVSVSFRDKEADAVVSFAPKGGTRQQGMTMNYTMERQGSEWHIKKRGSNGHGAQAAPGGDSSTMPPGHPPMSGGAGGGAQLPAGHPSLSGSSN